MLGNFFAETRLVKVNCTCLCVVIFYFSSHVSFAKVSVQSLFPSHVFHISIFSCVFDSYIYSTTPTPSSHRFHLVGFALGLCPWSMADNLSFYFFFSITKTIRKTLLCSLCIYLPFHTHTILHQEYMHQLHLHPKRTTKKEICIWKQGI